MKTIPDKKPTLDTDSWLKEHGDYLYRYALVRVRDAATAEDLLQETLLAGMKSYPQHEGRSSERTWLVGIMRHKIVDHFRRLARTPDFQLGNEADDESRWFESQGKWQGHWREDQAPVSWPVDAVQLLEWQAFWETLERCVNQLSPQMAVAFTLRELDGLSSEEICEILNISPNNLWVLLHRSRSKLRRLLEVEWFRGHSPSTRADKADQHSRIRISPVPAEFHYRAVAA